MSAKPKGNVVPLAPRRRDDFEPPPAILESDGLSYAERRAQVNNAQWLEAADARDHAERSGCSDENRTTGGPRTWTAYEWLIVGAGVLACGVSFFLAFAATGKLP